MAATLQNQSDVENDWMFVSSPNSSNSSSSSSSQQGDQYPVSEQENNTAPHQQSSDEPCATGMDDGLSEIDLNDKNEDQKSPVRSVKFFTNLNEQRHPSIQTVFLGKKSATKNGVSLRVINASLQYAPRKTTDSDSIYSTESDSNPSTEAQQQPTYPTEYGPTSSKDYIATYPNDYADKTSTKEYTVTYTTYSPEYATTSSKDYVPTYPNKHADKISSNEYATTTTSPKESVYSTRRATKTSNKQDKKQENDGTNPPDLVNILCLIISLIFAVTLIVSIYMLSTSEDSHFAKDQDRPGLIDVGPENHLYPDLKLLDEDIAECIKRHNPNVLNADSQIQRTQLDANPLGGHGFFNYKLFQGLVCYEQEVEWRKKFDQLKSERNLDLRRVVKQAKKRLTTEMLEYYHPSLKFGLILNQLEYLDYLDQQRKDRTLERLKAENLDLLRQLKDLRSKETTNQQTPLSNIEIENSKLRQENGALKASLAEKAGTVYIKQSLELEKCERENTALKKFHYQVAQEVSKGLKQLDLHTIDAAAILDDHESLNSQLALTRGYLLRFGEEVGSLIARNKLLTNEIKETQRVVSSQIENINNRNESVEESYLKNDNPNVSPSNNYQYEQSNWLMRRAKLRERLRKTTGFDVLERNVDHIIGHSRMQQHKHVDNFHEDISHEPKRARHPHLKSGKKYHPDRYHKHDYDNKHHHIYRQKMRDEL